jgi:hypothetical protein
VMLLHAEIIDRVAVAVGKQVITSSQIDTEVRVTAFLNGGGTEADPVAARKKAAGRLIDQTLIRKEIELTRFPVPKPDEAAPLLQQAKTVHGDGYTNALKMASLTEDDVLQHLLWQLTFLRFVQYRFQPGVSLTDNEVRDFYNEQSARFKAQGKTTPAFDAIRKDLETILTQRYVDEALDRWLAEQRSQAIIVFRLKGLEP